MDPKMQAIFEPLRKAIEAQPYTASDFMQFLGSLVGADQGIARAACLHASDIFEKQDDDQTYATIIAEVYRRVFFDETCASMYGTTQVLDAGEEVAKDFVRHVISNLNMDNLQDSKGPIHPAARDQ